LGSSINITKEAYRVNLEAPCAVPSASLKDMGEGREEGEHWQYMAECWFGGGIYMRRLMMMV